MHQPFVAVDLPPSKLNPSALFTIIDKIALRLEFLSAWIKSHLEDSVDCLFSNFILSTTKVSFCYISGREGLCLMHVAWCIQTTFAEVKLSCLCFDVDSHISLAGDEIVIAQQLYRFQFTIFGNTNKPYSVCISFASVKAAEMFVILFRSAYYCFDMYIQSVYSHILPILILERE